jgi:UrcA family protein
MITAKGLNVGGRLLAAAAVVLTLPVVAAGVTGPDVAVRYADLDVNSVSGATQLLQRIESAADNVCARLDHGDLSSRGNRERCEQKLTAAAVTKVNHPVLAQVYESAHHTAPRVAAVVR